MNSIKLCKATVVIALMFFASISSAQSAGNITYDLGVSTGTVNDNNYTEANFGLNYFVQDWLVWRNAIFSRFSSEADDFFGLDSSMRAFRTTGFSESSYITLFGGPGARLPNKGDASGFAEVGVKLSLAGLNLGFGVKSFFTDSNSDTQYFLILSGSGQL